MNFLPVAELSLGTLLWAFSFVATTWCLESFSPASVVAMRFFISFAISFLLFHVIPRRRIDFETLKLAALPSLLLCGIMVFTAWGQKYTTATNASFITCIYVLYVPIFEKLFSHKSIRLVYWFFILLGLCGSALICNLQNLSLNQGDLLVMIGSIFAGAQIYWFGVVAKKIKSGFVFNTWQSFFTMLPPLVYVLCFEQIPTQVTARAWWGIFIMGIGSSLIAFSLQVRGQKKISATTASLIYQIESPIAAIFAFFFLKERLSKSQIFGALLIFAAAFGASVFAKRKLSAA